MLWKFVSVALLAVGVFGRTAHVPDYSSYDPYDPLKTANRNFLEQFCTHNDTISSETLSQVTSSFESVTQCISGLFDQETVMREFREAAINNDYTDFFKRYCARTQELKICLRHLYTGLALCQTAEQVSAVKKIMNDFLEFTCGNNGAKLDLFFKEGGAQCVQEKSRSMYFCFQSTPFYRTSAKGTPINGIEMACEHRTCVVKGLKGCQNPIPGKLAEEFWDIVMEDYQCPKEPKNTKPDDLPNLLNSEFSKKLELLKKKKLELEVRTAEIEAWNRENELNIQHTDLTSDIKTSRPAIPVTNQME